MINVIQYNCQPFCQLSATLPLLKHPHPPNQPSTYQSSIINQKPTRNRSPPPIHTSTIIQPPNRMTWHPPMLHAPGSLAVLVWKPPAVVWWRTPPVLVQWDRLVVPAAVWPPVVAAHQLQVVLWQAPLVVPPPEAPLEQHVPHAPAPHAPAPMPLLSYRARMTLTPNVCYLYRPGQGIRVCVMYFDYAGHPCTPEVSSTDSSDYDGFDHKGPDSESDVE